jgi:hypothetical protein
MKPADNAPTRRTPETAACDLIVLGEILQGLGAVDGLSPSLVRWLGDQVAAAAGEVYGALELPLDEVVKGALAKLPEPEKRS